MVAVYIAIGFVAGAVLLFLLMKLRNNRLAQTNSFLTTENETLTSLNNKNSEENKALMLENIRLNTEARHFSDSMEQLKESFRQERIKLEEHQRNIEHNAEKLRIESDRQWQIKFEKLKEEFQNAAQNILSNQQTKLQRNNKEQFEELLKPVKEQFESFKKSIEDSKTSNEVAKKELKDSFEATMRLFAQQQSQTVEALKQETLKIGNDAANLTNALKRDTKKQGNWGELILETLLESSGLEKDLHFFIQETVRDEDGNMLRPDVIVKFPEGKSVIIDSKVSLTAYTEAFESEDPENRRRRLKDHARSVKKHIDELSVKKYDTVVADAIGFILMFIPNDQCYLAALEEDPELSRYAYNKGIVIISPSNLMMALQLAFNMWQQDNRNKNMDNIVRTATELYEKVAVFSETLDTIEKQLSGLMDNFNKAKTQLYTGKGNIMKRVENLKSLGIVPKKKIRGLEEE